MPSEGSIRGEHGSTGCRAKWRPSLDRPPQLADSVVLFAGSPLRSAFGEVLRRRAGSREEIGRRLGAFGEIDAAPGTGGSTERRARRQP